MAVPTVAVLVELWVDSSAAAKVAMTVVRTAETRVDKLESTTAAMRVD